MYSEVRVIEHIPPKSSKQPYRVIVEDDTEPLTLIFFKAYVDSLQRNLPVGEERVISGKLDSFNGFWQMSHPDYIVKPAEMDKVLGIETVYPLTAGISNKMLNKWIKQALERVPAFPEWLNEEYRKNKTGLDLKTRYPPHTTRKMPMNCCLKARRGCVWPMTNCWPTSWLWPSYGKG